MAVIKEGGRPCALYYATMLYELIFLLLGIAFLLLKNAVQVENYLSRPSIKTIPFVPQGTFRQTFTQLPRDQAMEKLEAMCPRLEDVDDFPKENADKLLNFLFGDSVFFSNDEVWLKHHKVMRGSFSQNKFANVILSSFETLCNHWSKMVPENEQIPLVVVVHDFVGRTVFQTLGIFAYGHNYNCIVQRSQHFENYMELIESAISESRVLHYAKMYLKNFNFLQRLDRFFKVRQNVYAHFDTLIKARRAELEGMNDAEKAEKIDVLSSMIIKFPEYDDLSIAEDLMTLFFAGHDTTGASISFTLYLLAKYPEFQGRAHEEAKKFMLTFDPKEKDLTDTDLKERLPYLYAVILESWRVLPPAAGNLNRVVKKDNVYLGGHYIPKGMVLMGSMISTHHSKKVWGDDAGQFNPARFCIDRDFDMGVDLKIVKKLLTFSVGPRMCLGERFATIQLFLGLAKILSQYHFEMPKDSPHAERCLVRPFIPIMAPLNMELLVSRV